MASDNTTTENRAAEEPSTTPQSGEVLPNEVLPKTDRFNIAPLIKLTLLSFYTALMVPLPFLAEATQAPVPPALMWFAMGLGYVALWGALSERVEVDDVGIAVVYPSWVRAFGRKGWSLKWADITALKPRSTGQNGIVYYFLNQAQDRAYLLPVRVIGFARLIRYVEAKTNIDMRDVKPLAQPWMYLFLLGLTALLLLLDIWTIATAGRLVS
ncbi:MAG: hypothetical protein AAFQ63_04500 [Cyanobacteria bacterium J06621_11]